MDSMIGRPMTRDGAEFDQVESPVPEPPDLADSPSPRTDLSTLVIEALTDEGEIAHAEGWTRGIGRCAYCDRMWPCRTQRAVERLLAKVRAAQEAPAPEGLRHNPWASPTSEFDRAEDVLAGMLALQRLRGRLSKVTVSDVRALLAAIPQSAPPSPAEPPRPDHQHHYEHDFRCGTCGATFLAALRDDETEARPPEGLPWLDLVADIRAVDGNHDLGAGELAERLVARGQDEPPTRLLPALLERIANRAHQGWLSENVEAEFRTIEAEARLAARLSARGAE